MRKLVITFILILAMAVPVGAQSIRLDFPDLAERADETVDITLDAAMLKLASRFLSDDDAD